MQEAESERLSRLENQVTQLSDALLTLGPAINQLVQLQQAQMPPPGIPPVVQTPQIGTPVWVSKHSNAVRSKQSY